MWIRMRMLFILEKKRGNIKEKDIATMVTKLITYFNKNTNCHYNKLKDIASQDAELARL